MTKALCIQVFYLEKIQERISVGTRLTREGNPSSQSKRLLSETQSEDLRIDLLKKEKMMDIIQPQPSPQEAKALDLRTNPFQEEGDDGKGPSTTFHQKQEPSQERPRSSQERLRPSQEILGQEDQVRSVQDKLGESRTRRLGSKL